MNGTWSRALPLSLLAVTLLASCSRAPQKEVRSEPTAEPPAGARPTTKADAASSAPAPAEAKRVEDDNEMADFGDVQGLPPAGEKEEPSLSQAPAEGPAEEWSDSDAAMDRLEKDEVVFNHKMDPTALSCSGALPLRDTICSLAERICGLPPSATSSTAEQDCKRARASCEKARRSYAGRCGG